jgi:hypothetical protein
MKRDLSKVGNAQIQSKMQRIPLIRRWVALMKSGRRGEAEKVKSYESRLKSQIRQYRKVENIHELPDIFHYWSNKFLRPRLNAVCGADTIAEFYAGPFVEASKRTTNSARFLSIGSGDCGVEIAVVKSLFECGVRDFKFECLEASPHLIDRAIRAISEEKLKHILSIERVDINRWSPNDRYAGVMANHTLHHLAELEKIFDGVRSSLEPGGVFVTNDMIGRNGHMRWPESLEVINKIWAFLPNRLKFNRQHNRLDRRFVNWDCSTEGFEGFRSQDILHLLMERFHFKAFLAFGGIIEIFTDRSFGHNFDPNKSRDRAFIDFVNFLNDTLIDDGVVKPTTMFAVLGAEPVAETRQWRHWSPQFSLRKPSD